jgi:hypothetical protein
LQYEVDLSAIIHTELAKYRGGKIKVHRETPIFKAEPAQIPRKKSEPKRSVMVFWDLRFGLDIEYTVLVKT